MSAPGAFAAEDPGLAAGSGRSAAAGEPSVGRLAALVFAALVFASFAAFFVTQRLKHTPTAVQRFELTPFFSPTPGGRHKREPISFRIRERDDVTVTIVDAAGATVATLARERALARYTQLSLAWDGRRGGVPEASSSRSAAGTPADPIAPVHRGAPAPAGVYRVRVSLRRQQRAVLSPKSFTLVRRPLGASAAASLTTPSGKPAATVDAGE